MVRREITPRLVELFQQYPFVTVTGPRQSGKTTLCRTVFPDLAYVNLEAPDQREFAESDPRAFLARLDGGAIIDEIQRVPSLLSYLQVLADEKGRNSLFVLTGSEQFQLSDAIGQSLAGRTALLRLLPFTLAERRQSGASNEMDDILFSGFYPRIHDQGLDPRQALGDYFETYVERDVRQLGEIRNLSSFQRFVRLCAGRVGQLVNLSSLGADVGVTHTTARQWLTVLEASYIVFQLQPFHSNVQKRLIKSPKLYFYDVGLASYLIGIENVKQIATHPLRGSLFENAVVMEALKHRFNRGHRPNLSFYRSVKGLECDLFYETGRGIAAIEIKSGTTIASDYVDSLNRVARLVPDTIAKFVVYGGTERQSRSDCEVVPLADVGAVLERFEAEQAISALVEERRGSEPAIAEVERLDAVYQELLLPTLESLEAPLRKTGEGLFRHFSQVSFIVFGQHEIESEDLLQPVSWETTKEKHFTFQGFALSDLRPIEIGHRYSFRNFAGKGWEDFDLELAISWRLESESLARKVSFNDEIFFDYADRILYTELRFWRAEMDRFATRICRDVLQLIERLSS